jgi:ABC-type uncharacterized transport system permease subunit
MLPIAVLVIYDCSCLWLIASLWRNNSPRSSQGRLLTGTSVAGLAALMHAGLLYHALFNGTDLAMNTSETTSLVGLIVAIITIAATPRRPRFAGISAVLLQGAGIAAAITDDGSRSFATSQTGWELTTHIIIAIVAYALITVGAVFALALSALDRRLHKHQPLGALASLPSVEALEAAMFQTIAAGFALLTLTLFSGFIFVQDLVAQHLAHKVALSCLAWVILGVLLLGRWRFGWRGRTAARWAVWGFILLLLAYFGSKFVLEVILGRHWG